MVLQCRQQGESGARETTGVVLAEDLQHPARPANMAGRRMAHFRVIIYSRRNKVVGGRDSPIPSSATNRERYG